MNTKRSSPILFLLVLGALSVQAEEPVLGPAEGATVHALATTMETLEDWVANQENCPLEPGLHPLEKVRDLFPTDMRNRVVVQDGWTRPFFAWCNDSHWALISYGADGEPASNYALLPALGEAGDDFVALDGKLAAAPEPIFALQRIGQQKRSMVDMRSIGIVFEAYALDNDVYPGGPVAEMIPVAQLLPQVQPIYIRTLPLNDAWGNPFLYWTDGKDYRIASAGHDGIFEANYAASPGLGGYPRADDARDIVFGNGQYEQWPEGPEDE